MSLAATRWAWAQRVPPSAKLVLLALADCVHSRGQVAVCWPSVARVARMTGLGRRTVYKALDTLEAAGLVARLPGRKGRTTVYRLRLASGEAGAVAEPAPAAQEAAPEPPPEPAAPAADGAAGEAPQRSGQHRAGELTAEQEGRFQRFWSIYPRRVAKADARRAWAQVDPDEALTERICAAVEAASKSAQWRREGGRYIPYPATWLRREGWEDEHQPQLPAERGESADERVQGTVAAVQRLFGEQKGGEQS